MSCNCCGKKINIGMIHKVDLKTSKKFKSCPHVYHPYPASFGKTPARKTARNPDGYQSYCADCRSLDKGLISPVYKKGRVCSSFA